MRRFLQRWVKRFNTEAVATIEGKDDTGAIATTEEGLMVRLLRSRERRMINIRAWTTVVQRREMLGWMRRIRRKLRRMRWILRIWSFVREIGASAEV